MTGNIVSRRYARALFAIGQAEGPEELARYGEGLSLIGKLLAESAELSQFFRNPVFSSEEKKSVLKEIFKKNDSPGMFKNFCFLLADKGRLALLPEIENYFNELLDVSQGVVRGELISAVSLSDSLCTSIQNSLKKQVNKEVRLGFSVDQGLLGGFKLKIGDKVMDASIKAQLEILKENIKRGE